MKRGENLMQTAKRRRAAAQLKRAKQRRKRSSAVQLSPTEIAAAQWLGCVLQSSPLLYDEEMTVDHFTVKAHRDLYSALLQIGPEDDLDKDLPRLRDQLQSVGYSVSEAADLMCAVLDHGCQLAHFADYAAILHKSRAEQRDCDDPSSRVRKNGRQEPSGDSSFLEFTTEQLLEQQEPLRWLLPGMLTQNEPAVIVGPSKSLKTSIAVDLCAALASGEKFLGQFAAARAFRVGLVSSTTDQHALTDLARRWSAASSSRSKRLPNLTWALSSDGSTNLENLRDWIAKHQLEVVVIDPLRLTSTGKSTQAAELCDLVRCCLENGATPILCCQSRKAIKSDASDIPRELGFARQWLLVRHRQNYLPGSGQHRLQLTLGGYAGQGGEWGVDIDEGSLQDPTGRRWDVTLREPQSIADETAACEAEAHAQRLRAKIRVAIQSVAENDAFKSRIRERSGISGARFEPVWSQMLTAGEVEPNPNFDRKTHVHPTYRLAERGSPPEKKEAVRSNPEAAQRAVPT
ncbi:hypothetical protein DSM3645_13475 [Blastopirellula marina DSM 3645]|uniref:DNA helicase DnaB-like N-terminal domain-containing protein n=2 Tax=Blastopirellula marina TaxID=124 RepID=A3ZWK3_9BACT|nr:hypothetical protein DSM3645_13475 [Blastopirellula marina DSM 3645]